MLIAGPGIYQDLQLTLGPWNATDFPGGNWDLLDFLAQALNRQQSAVVNLLLPGLWLILKPTAATIGKPRILINQTKLNQASRYKWVLENLGYWQGQAWRIAISWDPQKYLHEQKNLPAKAVLLSWLLPPFQGLKRLLESQVPCQKTQTPVPTGLSVTHRGFSSGLCGQHTAQDTSEHKESFSVSQVRLTLMLSKLLDNRMLFKQFQLYLKLLPLLRCSGSTASMTMREGQDPRTPALLMTNLKNQRG